MSRKLIASKLIESVRRRASVPDDNADYDDLEVLDVINEEFDTEVLPELIELHEEHLVTYVDIKPHKKDEIGYRYIIPSRALGSKLRDAFYYNNGGYEELYRIDLDEIGDYRGDYGNYNRGSNLFFIQGDEITVINPTYGGNLELRVYFYLRPNRIVLERECAQIQDIDRTTGMIQFVSMDKRLSNLQVVDFIQDKNPNKILSIEIEVSDVNTSTRSLVVDPSKIPDRLSVGDWVCRTEQSPYPNVPIEMHKLLAQASAVKLLEELGDAQNYGIAVNKLTKMVKSIKSMMDNRIEGAPRKIKNRYSPLSSGGSYGGRRRRGRY